MNRPQMLRQTLEALVRSWENFSSMGEKTQKASLAEQRLWLGSSSALAPWPKNDFWTHASSCHVSQPRGNLPTGFWSYWNLCWMFETMKQLLDFLPCPIPCVPVDIYFYKAPSSLKETKTWMQRWQLCSPGATKEQFPWPHGTGALASAQQLIEISC